MTQIDQLAQQVGELAKKHNIMLTTAESCTGGWIAQAITSVAGSSAWFDRGFVSYSNAAKQEMLGVQAKTLDEHGAVSEAVVKQMALGALQQSHAHVSVAVSGIAGPAGGGDDKPVGTVWFAWANKEHVLKTQCEHFSGDRQAVRQQTVIMALRYLCDLLL